jgi:hypothetical protein
LSTFVFYRPPIAAVPRAMMFVHQWEMIETVPTLQDQQICEKYSRNPKEGIAGQKGTNREWGPGTAQEKADVKEKSMRGIKTEVGCTRDHVVDRELLQEDRIREI